MADRGFVREDLLADVGGDDGGYVRGFTSQ